MKRILVIAEGFYNYDMAIKNEFEKNGYEVYLFEAQAKLNVFLRLINKFVKNKLRISIEEKIQSEKLLNQHWDIVFVICGHSLRPSVLKKMKETMPNTEFILYLWDDVERIKTFGETKECYNRIITFDRIDAQKYGFEFRPLFFLDEYKYDHSNKKYDVCFLGGVHSDRSVLVEKIIGTYFCEASKFVYGIVELSKYIKIKLKCLLGEKNYVYENTHTKSIDSKFASNVLKKSRFTIDIQHPTQKGLTMRTIESIAAKTKLITTNVEVQYYDFYNSNNVCIIDRNNPLIDETFLMTEWCELDSEIIEKYSLSEWAKDVLNKSEERKFVIK